MSTAEIAVIVAAFVVVLVIVVVLVVRAGRDDEAEPEARTEGSMFDQPPSDTLAKLGKAEHQPETADLAAVDEPGLAAPEASERAMTGPEEAAAEGEGAAEVETFSEAGASQPASEPDEVAEAGKVAASEAAVTEQPPEPAADEAVAQEAAARGNLVPLSSIIVTTSNKIVDLDDPEIRRMLTDLVTFEIDQAEQFREQGQRIDAVLQLTEAEKICRALGKDDTAREIRAMMRELQG